MRELIEQQLPDLMPVYNDDFPGRNMTILGSFKGWNKIKEYRERFRELGYWVLAPQGEDVIDFAGSFEILDTDAAKIQRLTEHLGRSPTKPEMGRFIETLFLQALDISDFAYVVGLDRNIDDGSYIGEQVAGEIGYTAGQQIPVFSDGPISPTLDEREGLITMFPGYIETMVQSAAPEKVLYELEARNLGARGA